MRKKDQINGVSGITRSETKIIQRTELEKKNTLAFFFNILKSYNSKIRTGCNEKGTIEGDSIF